MSLCNKAKTTYYNGLPHYSWLDACAFSMQNFTRMSEANFSAAAKQLPQSSQSIYTLNTIKLPVFVILKSVIRCVTDDSKEQIINVPSQKYHLPVITHHVDGVVCLAYGKLKPNHGFVDGLVLNTWQMIHSVKLPLQLQLTTRWLCYLSM